LLPLSSSYARQLVEVDATPYVVVLPSAKNSMVPQALAVMVPATGPSTAAFLCYRWHSCLPTFNAFNVGRFHTDLQWFLRSPRPAGGTAALLRCFFN
jgi:hypothetical protein